MFGRQLLKHRMPLLLAGGGVPVKQTDSNHTENMCTNQDQGCLAEVGHMDETPGIELCVRLDGRINIISNTTQEVVSK